jgi:DNA invertase Pin-like site-specific DNA recombinase
MLAAKVEAQMAAYGYARVSTDGQTLAAQEAELIEAGCDALSKQCVFFGQSPISRGE